MKIKTFLPRIIAVALMASLTSILTSNGAEPVDDLDKQIESIDRQTAPTRKPTRNDSLETVSKETGISEQELRQQQQKSGMGAGSLFIANTLSKETGMSFDEIVALHKRGHGWGKIARDHNVKLGPLVSNARKLEKDRKKKSSKDKSTREKPPETSTETKRERDDKSEFKSEQSPSPLEVTKKAKPKKESKGKKK